MKLYSSSIPLQSSAPFSASSFRFSCSPARLRAPPLRSSFRPSPSSFVLLLLSPAPPPLHSVQDPHPQHTQGSATARILKSSTHHHRPSSNSAPPPPTHPLSLSFATGLPTLTGASARPPRHCYSNTPLRQHRLHPLFSYSDKSHTFSHPLLTPSPFPISPPLAQKNSHTQKSPTPPFLPFRLLLLEFFH